MLSARASVLASAVLLALLAWLVAAMFGAGSVGLAERVVAVAEALWPLGVVLFAGGARVGRWRGASGSVRR